jgi:K+-transporting ATPase ATPase B chain
MTRQNLPLFDRALLWPAVAFAFRKLDPRVQWRNPVMFVVYVGSILTSLLWLQAAFGRGEAPAWFVGNVTVWLWFTVLFANFAEALAEGRSKAQAASLRGLKHTVWAHKLTNAEEPDQHTRVRADDLRRGDLVRVSAGEYIPPMARYCAAPPR